MIQIQHDDRQGRLPHAAQPRTLQSLRVVVVSSITAVVQRFSGFAHYCCSNTGLSRRRRLAGPDRRFRSPEVGKLAAIFPGRGGLGRITPRCSNWRRSCLGISGMQTDASLGIGAIWLQHTIILAPSSTLSHWVGLPTRDAPGCPRPYNHGPGKPAACPTVL